MNETINKRFTSSRISLCQRKGIKSDNIEFTILLRREKPPQDMEEKAKEKASRKFYHFPHIKNNKKNCLRPYFSVI